MVDHVMVAREALRLADNELVKADLAKCPEIAIDSLQQAISFLAKAVRVASGCQARAIADQRMEKV